MQRREANERFAYEVLPYLESTGTRTISVYETEASENTFPNFPYGTVMQSCGSERSTMPARWTVSTRHFAGGTPISVPNLRLCLHRSPSSFVSRQPHGP